MVTAPGTVSGDHMTTTEAPITTPSVTDSPTTTAASTEPSTVPPTDGVADLSLTKDDCSTAVSRGGTYSFSFNVSNHGTGPANNVVLVDAWPAHSYNVIAVGSACTPLSLQNTITCSWNQIPSGASVAVEIRYSVRMDVAIGSQVSNCATVSTASPESRTADNSDCDTNVIAACLSYNAVCAIASDCCSPLRCLRHASNCGGSLTESYRCALDK